MTATQVVETSVTVSKSRIQDCVHQDDHQPTYEKVETFHTLSTLERIRKSPMKLIKTLFLVGKQSHVIK